MLKLNVIPVSDLQDRAVTLIFPNISEKFAQIWEGVAQHREAGELFVRSDGSNSDGVNSRSAWEILESQQLQVLSLEEVRSVAPEHMPSECYRVGLIDTAEDLGAWFIPTSVEKGSWKWSDKSVDPQGVISTLSQLLLPRINLPIKIFYVGGPMEQTLPNFFSVNINSVPWFSESTYFSAQVPLPDSVFGVKLPEKHSLGAFLPFGGEVLFFSKPLFCAGALHRGNHLYVHLDLLKCGSAGTEILQQLLLELLQYYRSPKEYEANVRERLREESFEHFCQFLQTYRAQRVRMMLEELAKNANDQAVNVQNLLRVQGERKEHLALSKVIEKFAIAQKSRLLEDFPNVLQLPQVIDVQAQAEAGLVIVTLGPIFRRASQGQPLRELGIFDVFIYRPSSQNSLVRVVNKRSRLSDTQGVLQAPNLLCDGAIADIDVEVACLKSIEGGEFSAALERIISYLEKGDPTSSVELLLLESFPVLEGDV